MRRVRQARKIVAIDNDDSVLWFTLDACRTQNTSCKYAPYREGILRLPTSTRFHWLRVAPGGGSSELLIFTYAQAERAAHGRTAWSRMQKM